MSALDDLIKAVEAGKAGDDIIGAVFSPNDIPSWHINQLACDAYNGSLDAALRLHEALLPGYPFPNSTTTTEVVIFGVSRPGEGGATGWSKVPSRAWLLAILRALQAQSTPLDEPGPVDPRRRG